MRRGRKRMKWRSRIDRFSLLTALFLFLTLSGPKHSALAQDTTKLPCSDCHVCPSPTTKEPCLKSCTRPEKGQDTKSSRAGPDVAILGQLADMYELVRFTPRLHAGMVGRG